MRPCISICTTTGPFISSLPLETEILKTKRHLKKGACNYLNRSYWQNQQWNVDILNAALTRQQSRLLKKFPFGKEMRERKKKIQHLLKQKLYFVLQKSPLFPSKSWKQWKERGFAHSTDHIRAWQSSTVETSIQIRWMWENSSLWEMLGFWGTGAECSTWDTSARAKRDACCNTDLQTWMHSTTTPSELKKVELGERSFIAHTA